MKLFIDDFREAPDATWVVCRTVTDAIRTMAQYPRNIDEVSLDHDISHEVRLDESARPYPCKEDFSAVAYFMGALWGEQKGGIGASGMLPKDMYPDISIHSANPVGAENIARILSDYGMGARIRPFPVANRVKQAPPSPRALS